MYSSVRIAPPPLYFSPERYMPTLLYYIKVAGESLATYLNDNGPYAAFIGSVSVRVGTACCRDPGKARENHFT